MRRDKVTIRDLDARLVRIEQNQHNIMRAILIVDKDVQMAYEAELDAAEAAAEANKDAKDAAKGLLVKLIEIIAKLKAADTDPATSARIDALTAKLHSMTDDLAAAVVAGTPAEAP